MGVWVEALILAASPGSFDSAFGLAQDKQEDADAELERLGQTITAEGAGPKLAALLKSEVGRLVVKERIAGLVARSLERLDRDPWLHYERHLFVIEDDGHLRLRPDRKKEFDALSREVQRRQRAWADFDKAAADVASKIPASGPVGPKLKEYWSRADFRMAIYQRVTADSREPDAEALWDALVGRSLFRGADGKLRIRGNYREESLQVIAETRGEADGLISIKEQTDAILGKLRQDLRKTCGSPEGRLIIGRRLLEVANEGVEDFAAKMVEKDLVAEGDLHRFNDEFKPRLKELEALVALGAELKPVFQEVVRDAADDTESDRALKNLLKDELATAILAARMRITMEERRANREGAILPFRDDHFEADEKGTLSVRAGRFVNEEGKDSAEAIVAELDAILAERAAALAALDAIASRALDSVAASLFQTEAGASAVTEHQARIFEELKESEREAGIRRFARTYLRRSGEKYAVRPEWAGQVEEMTRRAAEVRQALDRASREEPEK